MSHMVPINKKFGDCIEGLVNSFSKIPYLVCLSNKKYKIWNWAAYILALADLYLNK